MKPPSVSRERPGSSSKSSDLSFTIAATLMQSFDPPAPLLHNSCSAGVSSRPAVAAAADHTTLLRVVAGVSVCHTAPFERRVREQAGFYLPADLSF